MNSFGRQFRVHIFGESHGHSVGVVVDGVPPGVSFTACDYAQTLQERKGGARATTPRKEADEPLFLSGLYNGTTTGAPLCIAFPNQSTRPSDYELFRDCPRPGHADFVATQKFGGFADLRGGGHFSARLTVGICIAGCLAQKIIAPMHIQAELVELGGHTDIEQGIQRAIAAKDSVGGVVRCVVSQVPIGLGEPFFDSCEALLAHAMFSIPAVKAVSFGSGMSAARMVGSVYNDPIIDGQGQTKTNHSGGINGGISNGNPIVFEVVFRPASSTPQPQTTFDFASGQMRTLQVKGRHDLCIPLRACPIVRAFTAITLADLQLLCGRK